MNETRYQTYKKLLKSSDPRLRKMSHDEMLHYYKSNQHEYGIIMRKPVRDWNQEDHHMVSIMDRIKKLLKL